jgi:hypothetical protein
MTLLWVDGFDTYGTANAAPSPANIMNRKYTGTGSATNAFRIREARVSGNSIVLSTDTSFARTSNLNTSSTVIVGQAVKFGDPGGSNGFFDLWRARDHSDSEFITVRMRYGIIQVLIGSTIMAETSGFRAKQNVWYYVETKVFIDGSAGTVTIRVNGIEVLNVTGLDTLVNAPASVKDIRLIGSINLQFWVDDFYIADDSGYIHTDFLGSMITQTIRPDADATANFTTSTPSANHFENVDETIVDDDTSYVESNTSGQRELYDHGNLSALTTVKAAGLNVIVNDGGVNQAFQHLVSSNGTENVSGNITINSSSYLTKLYVSEQDPDINAAWTLNTINAAKFGFQIP